MSAIEQALREAFGHGHNTGVDSCIQSIEGLAKALSTDSKMPPLVDPIFLLNMVASLLPGVKLAVSEPHPQPANVH